MMVKNKTNKNYKRSQKGRSMVEMLGVLAIVGVLSVGGVYGYGVAMKKHKANELLHQASMLASSIAAQIASGKTDLALENFGNSSNGSFSSVKGPDGSSNYQSGDDKFTMQITGMDSAVCEQMQGMKGGTVRSVSCSAPDANGKVTATLAFNKDLSSTPVASDYNKDTTGKECTDGGFQWCSAKGENGSCSNTSDCCEGIDIDSRCQTECNSDTGEITNKEDGIECDITEEKKGICKSGSCVENLCENVVLGKCQESCDPLTGTITNAQDDSSCAYTDGKEDGVCLSGECVQMTCSEITDSMACQGTTHCKWCGSSCMDKDGDDYCPCENLGFRYNPQDGVYVFDPETCGCAPGFESCSSDFLACCSTTQGSNGLVYSVNKVGDIDLNSIYSDVYATEIYYGWSNYHPDYYYPEGCSDENLKEQNNSPDYAYCCNGQKYYYTSGSVWDYESNIPYLYWNEGTVDANVCACADPEDEVTGEDGNLKCCDKNNPGYTTDGQMHYGCPVPCSRPEDCSSRYQFCTCEYPFSNAGCICTDGITPGHTICYEGEDVAEYICNGSGVYELMGNS